jgi:hypothetical protein
MPFNCTPATTPDSSRYRWWSKARGYDTNHDTKRDAAPFGSEATQAKRWLGAVSESAQFVRRLCGKSPQSIWPGLSCEIAVWPRSEHPSAARKPKPLSVKFNPLRTVRPTPSYGAQRTYF